MKKCLVLALLTLVSAVTACKKSAEDDENQDDGSDYVSITNLRVDSVGTLLTESPAITWQLGFPIFYALDAAISSSSSIDDDVVPWTSIGAVTSYRFTGLSLSECTNYYPVIRARGFNNEVLDSHIVQTPFRIDTTDPTAPGGLTVGTDANESESATASWTASTDNCALSGYEVAVGTTAGDTDVVDWSPVAASPHQVTSGATFDFGTLYYTSVRAIDTAARDSAVTTSSAWRLTSPSALLVGTQTMAGTDFNAGTSFVRWAGAILNSEYFAHSIITEPDVVTIRRAGNYIMHLTMPFTLQSGCAARCGVKAMVLVNGVPRTDSM